MHGCASVVPEGESLGELIEVGGLLEEDGDLGVDLPASLALDVLLLDGLDGRVAVLGEDLGELEGERDALAHALDLHAPVLFEDQLGQEEALVQPRAATDTVDVVLVELVRFLGHQHLI
jgi:hypothetical protein